MDINSMNGTDTENTVPEAPAEATPETPVTEEAPENASDAGGPVGMDETPPEDGASDAAPPDAPPEPVKEEVEENPLVAEVEGIAKGLEDDEEAAKVRNSERLHAIRLLKMAAVHIRQI